MKQQATPGPWEVIAAKFVKDGCVDWTIKMSKQSISMTDARLIAAAPDLLSALQRIALGTENGQSFSGTDCAEIARAAIASATGEKA